MKSKSGFTLIEVIVVIAAMAILASIVVVGFAAQQRESRDSKRATDILALSEEFEIYYSKHGNYPVACNTGLLSNEDVIELATFNCGGDKIVAIYGANDLATVHHLSTPESLRQSFPRIIDTFGDPQSQSQHPINASSAAFGVIPRTSYFVFSPDLLPDRSIGQTSGSVRFYTNTPGPLTCSFTLQPNIRNQSATKPHRYIMGYFSETDRAWQFYISQSRPEVNNLTWGTDPSDPCAARDISQLKMR